MFRFQYCLWRIFLGQNGFQVIGNKSLGWFGDESVGLFFRQRNRMGLRIFGVLFCVDFSSHRMG
jgi:hypothetical protein